MLRLRANAGHQAAISIHKHCQREDIADRLPFGMNLATSKMGMHEWSYSNEYDPIARQKMMHVEMPLRFSKILRMCRRCPPFHLS